MRRVVAIFTAFMKSWRRSKSAIFWTIAFPVLMILLFGAIFREESAAVDLYIQNKDLDPSGEPTWASQFLTEALNQTEALNLYFVPSEVDGLSYVEDDAEETGRGERLLIIPEGFDRNATSHLNATLIMVMDQTQQPSMIALGVVQGVLDTLNIQMTGGTRIFRLKPESLVAESFKYIDFFIPGVIAMTVMTIGVHGSIEVNTTYREKGIIKKLASTPLSKLEWILGATTNEMFICFLSTAIILTVGWIVFNVTVTINAYFIALIVAGCLLFPGIGMLIANFVREPEAAEAAANAITFPLMFLSGIFWPIEMLPGFLQEIAKVLPLTYLSEGLRDAMINADPTGALTNTLILVSLAAVFIIAGTIFTSWKEK